VEHVHSEVLGELLAITLLTDRWTVVDSTWTNDLKADELLSMYNQVHSKDDRTYRGISTLASSIPYFSST